MGTPQSNLPPGFRFHPTDEELIVHYLRKKIASLPLPVYIIAEVDIYKFDPWDLPAKAAFGEKEWYFFSPRDRKYPNGARPNRAAASGYWKATGTDKTIGVPKSIGVKKALVFYKGRPPKGIKTNWIMHEYRLVDNNKPIKLKDTSMRLDDWVLCRIYRKSKYDMSSSSPSSTAEASLLGGDQQDQAEEQFFLPKTSASITVNPHPPPQNTLISHKSLSFSNLLDAMDYSMLSSILSENHSNTPPGFGSCAANSGFVDHQSSSNNVTNPSLDLSVPNMENSRPKRQISHIDQDTLYPSKKYLTSSCSFPETNNQCENNTQWSFLLKHSLLLNQQLLLAPHLQFQG